MKTRDNDGNVNALRSGCRCTAPIMLRDGAVVCASCFSPVGAASASAEADFSSIALPPHTARLTFRRRCKSIPGAYKIGHVWYCPRAAWFASARRSAPRPIAPAAPAVTSDEELAAKMIADAGLRATRAA